MTQVIEEIGDNHEATDLSATLLKLIETAKAASEDDPFPVIYVEDRDGTRFTTAKLVKRELSDGSHVFDIILSDE
jgi:hypothetical protein